MSRTERVEDSVDDDGYIVNGYHRWDCQKCGAEVRRYRGQADVDCAQCGASYNAFGQRLKDNWRDNPSNYDSEIGDVEGDEIASLRRDAYLDGFTNG
jgi:hypothetical protein